MLQRPSTVTAISVRNPDLASARRRGTCGFAAFAVWRSPPWCLGWTMGMVSSGSGPEPGSPAADGCFVPASWRAESRGYARCPRRAAHRWMGCGWTCWSPTGCRCSVVSHCPTRVGRAIVLGVVPATRVIPAGIIEHDGMLWKPRRGATASAEEFIAARALFIDLNNDGNARRSRGVPRTKLAGTATKRAMTSSVPRPDFG